LPYRHLAGLSRPGAGAHPHRPAPAGDPGAADRPVAEADHQTSQLHWKPAGAERVAFGFHQDIRFRRPATAYRNTERCFVQTAIAVDPHRRESGAIRLYPKSHRLGDLALGGEGPVLDQALSEADLAARGLDPAALVDIELDPGDVALWGLFTVHGSGVNRAGHDRRVYINGYVTAADCDLGTWAFRDGRPCPLAL
jgi:ectoine hydroxylase-related dioxygenase (phytanoyl-CoA dioxygenase family)